MLSWARGLVGIRVCSHMPIVWVGGGIGLIVQVEEVPEHSSIVDNDWPLTQIQSYYIQGSRHVGTP